MRERLRRAREGAKLSQKELAEKLGISERYYRMLESGARNGDFEIWDTLEDIFGIHQRRLREISANESVERDLE